METLKVNTRSHIGRKNYQIRNNGKIPAVVYGSGIEPKNITVDRNEFIKLYRKLGESTLLELDIEGADTVNVLIQDIQLDPIRDEAIHADFRAVDMTKPIEAEAKIEFTGESLAIKGLGGTLVKPLETFTIRALPKNLVASIEVDLSLLNTFEDVIRVEDVKVPEGVEILDDQQRTIAVVIPPRTEAEMEALDKAVEEDVSRVEVEGEKAEETTKEGGESAEEKKEEAAE